MGEICEMCGIDEDLTGHHLIPRTCQAGKWFRKQFTKEQRQAKMTVCRSCHNFIHSQIKEKDLGRNYHTSALVMGHEAIKKFAEWRRKRV